MEKFNPYRMISRIECATRMLMLRYRLTTRQANADLMNIIVALSMQEMVSDSDRALLQQMALALANFVKQNESLHFTQEQVNESNAIGERETIFIFQKYPNAYADKILALTDFDEERKEYERQQARKRRRNRFIFFGAVACLILGIWGYNLPYFAEKRAFAELQEDFEKGSLYPVDIKNYFDEFPDGAHAEEVMILAVDLNDAGYEFDYRINAIHDYLGKYPEGRKAAEYRKFLDDLWVNGIAQYKSTVGDSPNDAQKFMIDMLEYMHTNKITQVYVLVHPELNLKEFTDYPETTQQLLNYFHLDAFSDLKSKIKPIKSELNESDVKDWASQIVNTLNSSAKRLFKTQIIDFIIVDQAEIPQDSKCPVIQLHYTVSNQESIIGIPDVWIYSETEAYSHKEEAKYAFLGIQMSFKAQFMIPGTNNQYTITAKGDPGSTVIRNVTNPYTTMSGRCSKGFYDQVIADFGLANE